MIEILCLKNFKKRETLPLPDWAGTGKLGEQK